MEQFLMVVQFFGVIDAAAPVHIEMDEAARLSWGGSFKI